jgi:hypothetical protein
MEIRSPEYKDCKDQNSFQSGLEFQDFVTDYLIREKGLVLTNYSSKYYQFNYGENPQGIEIKLDRRCTDTGRVSIEVGERSNLDVKTFTPSGILRGDNSWLYIVGNRRIFFIFSNRHLKNYYEKIHPIVIKDNPLTIEKFYLNFDLVVQNCEKICILDEALITQYPVLMDKSTQIERHIGITFHRKGERKEKSLFTFEAVQP